MDVAKPTPEQRLARIEADLDRLARRSYWEVFRTVGWIFLFLLLQWAYVMFCLWFMGILPLPKIRVRLPK